jgi:hypothetical protein
MYTYGLIDMSLYLLASQASHDPNNSMLSLAAFKETSDAGMIFT